jgi:hypothetical protein
LAIDQKEEEGEEEEKTRGNKLPLHSPFQKPAISLIVSKAFSFVAAEGWTAVRKGE